MRRAAAYHKEWILMELILACIFIVPPPVLTVYHVRRRTVAQKRLNDGNIILEKELSAVYLKRYGYINNEGELCYE